MSQEAADDKYEPRHYSQDFSEIVTVFVGPVGNQQQFAIHKNLVCAKSKFFNAACSKLWAEGKEKLVRLPETKAKTFQAYVVWIYTGKVSVDKSDATGEFTQTVQLYLLGDVLDDLQLRNETMRNLVNKNKVWKKQPSVELIDEIWESTAPTSRLRTMVVDVTIMRWGRGDLGSLEKYPKELLHALTLSLLRRVPCETDAKFVAGIEGYLEPEAKETSKQSN